MSITDAAAALRTIGADVPVDMLVELRIKLAGLKGRITDAIGGDHLTTSLLVGAVDATDVYLGNAEFDMHHLVEQIEDVANYHTG